MRFTFYRQYDTMDCGPACLRMVVKHYGRNISIQSLREKTQIGKDGVNLIGISEAAETVGLRAISVKTDVFSLMNNKSELPAILHWKQNHFVVLYKVNKQRFYIADPAIGLITYTKEEFKKCWISFIEHEQEEGVALFLQPTEIFFNQLNDFNQNHSFFNISRIFKYAIPHKRLFLKIFLATLVSSLSLLALPYLTKSMIDKGIGKSDINFISLVLIGQIALLASRLSIDFFRNRMLLYIGTRINLSILSDFLQKLMKLPIAFFDSKRTGDILQRMNDHSRIESFLTNSSINTILSIIQLVVFSVVLAVFNRYIFFIFILSSILYSLWVYFFLERRRKLDHKRFDLASVEQSAAIQLVQGMQEIKLNGVENVMRLNWEKVQKTLFRLSIDVLSVNQWQQAGAFFINEGKNLLITFIAAKSVVNGELTLGSMIAVQYILGQLNSPIEQLLGSIQSWQNAKMSMDRLDEVHKMEDEEPEYRQLHHFLPKEFAMQLTGGRGDLHYTNDAFNSISSLESTRVTTFISLDASIHFDGVSFTYPGAGNNPVLKKVTLSIPKGKTTAIVGTSGSGKSTLLKLILKFYEPDSGIIYCGGTGLSEISHSFWRKNCGVVMQESFIFSDTILKNIAVGIDDIDQERLELAMKTANVHDFVQRLPLKLNTKIGSEGSGISMGQKQRILIARAVYRDPNFIFFDEATNSLDANNESVIVKNLQTFFNGKTVVVVAHRLSTVMNADQIIVLDNGEIAEFGTHTELIQNRGIYFSLIRSQLELGS